MKKLFILGLSSILALTAFAQETGVKQNGFWDNWFIQVQGGASYTIGENIEDSHFFDMITPHAALSVGKFFSPQAGTRIQVEGWESKSYNYLIKDYYKRDYFQVNLDGMLNLTNVFTAYQEDRPFNFYGILGAGYVHGFKKDSYGIEVNDYFVPRAGIQADFRLSSVVSLNLEVMGSLMPDEFNGHVYGSKYDAVVSAMAGLTFHLPEQGFKVISSSNPYELQRLNAKINDQQKQLRGQQSELDRYRKMVENLRNRKPEIKEKIINAAKETELNAVVVFRMGSAALQDNQEINIYNAAKYLQKNPDMKVTVTGYADKSTGNATINQQLSEKRAKAVANILTNKYGISPSRITQEASGDKVQPFEKDEWNRVVIFTADKK